MKTTDTFTLEGEVANGGDNQRGDSLRHCVEKSLQQYFEDLDGQPSNDLYQLVLSEVEPPLLQAVLSYTRNNQSKAADMLGLNRGTLRKKLKQYNIV